MGPQAAGPRRVIAGIARWLQGQLQAAKHGGFMELPDSEASRVEEVEKTLHSSGLVGELNRLRDEVERKVTTEQTVIRSTVALGTGLSVGYVVWLLRGGLLLTSLLSSLPAWHIIDPWPVLSRFKRSEEEQEEETASEDQVEHMFDKAKTLMKRLRKTQSGVVAQPEASGSPPTTDETSKMKKG